MASLHDRHFQKNHQGMFLTTCLDVGTREVSGELGATGLCPFTVARPWSYLYFAREVYWNPREIWSWRPLKDSVHFLALDSLPSWDDQSISCSSGAQPRCYSGHLRVESLAGSFPHCTRGIPLPHRDSGAPLRCGGWGTSTLYSAPQNFQLIWMFKLGLFLRATIGVCKCLTFKAL